MKEQKAIKCPDNKERVKQPKNIREHVDHKSGECPICGIRLVHYGNMNYCHNCGSKLDWEEEKNEIK